MLRSLAAIFDEIELQCFYQTFLPNSDYLFGAMIKPWQELVELIDFEEHTSKISTNDIPHPKDPSETYNEALIVPKVNEVKVGYSCYCGLLLLLSGCGSKGKKVVVVGFCVFFCSAAELAVYIDANRATAVKANVVSMILR